MHEVEFAIIGNGIFGATIAAKLRQQGISVVTIDSQEPEAASPCAACLIKPSWIAGLGKENCAIGLDTLGELYPIKELNFDTPVGNAAVKWVDPKDILVPPTFREKVLRITITPYGYEINMHIIAKNLIIAAGVWTNEVLWKFTSFQIKTLAARTGSSFTIPGKRVLPYIKPFRPFRQLTRFMVDEDLAWVGDSEGYINYTKSQLEKSRQRCAAFVNDLPSKLLARTGHRPYTSKEEMENKPCYLQRPFDDLWVVTGGAKNGTIAAGWAAHQIAKTL